MTDLDRIAALIIAVDHNNLTLTARLLDELEASMEPEEMADLLEAILGEAPASPTGVAAPIFVACA